MKKFLALSMAVFLSLGALTACSDHAHTDSEKWEADASGHWKVCQECGEKTQSAGHTQTGVWEVDAAGHWQLCKQCGEKIQCAEHRLNDEDKCEACGTEIMDWGDSVGVSRFDQYNNLISMAEYDSDGELLTETVMEYEYDADGNVMNEKQYIDGQFYSETEYAVGQGETIPKKSTQYNDNGTKRICEFDQYGNIVRMFEYDENGTLDYESVSEFAQDRNGEWYTFKTIENCADGSKIEGEYNEYGDCTSMVTYGADGAVVSSEKCEYTYDEEGYPVSEKIYVDDVLEMENLYKTLSEDDGVYCYIETEIIYAQDGSKTVYVYDENGEPVSETQYDADGNVME